MKKPTSFVIISILYCAALPYWHITFSSGPARFWLLLFVGMALLITVAIVLGKPLFRKSDLSVSALEYGTVSAVFLYGLFAAGNIIIRHCYPAGEDYVKSLYSVKSGMESPWLLPLLLVCIGGGEELFWRGFLQKYFAAVKNRTAAFVVVLVMYTCLHAATGNPLLAAAALTGGGIWGWLYYKTGSVIPGMISHIIWDFLIFLIFPLYP